MQRTEPELERSAIEQLANSGPASGTAKDGLRCATSGPGNFSSRWWCRTCDGDHSALGGLLLWSQCTVVPDGAHAHLGVADGDPSFYSQAL